MTKLNSFSVVILLLVIGNLAYLDYLILYEKPFQKSEVPSANETVIEKMEYIDECGEECKKYIDRKLASLQTTPVPTAKTVVTAVRAKVQSTQYFPISVSGNTMSNDWVDISGSDFYFNTVDYIGLKQIQFEATIRLLNGNGKAYVRLFDVTNGIAVQGSQSEATSQSSTVVVASPTVFWSGRNLIRVQLKSLTADTAIFDSGRLKIITEN